MSLLLSDFYPRADAVLVSGNQIITGIKTFKSETIANIIRPDLGLPGAQNRIYLNSGIIFSANTPSINWRDRWLSGAWNFNVRPQVNGIGVVLQGEVAQANVVYQTGNQSITGIKTFTERIQVSEIRGTGLVASSTRINLENGQLYGGAEFVSIDYFRRSLSGNWAFNNRPTVNGSGVLLVGEAAGGGGTVENAVYTTGTQTITGPKNFTARPTLSGLNLITTGDLVDLELNIEGALASSSAFNGNRPIRRLPVLNTNYGGDTISGFLNNLFFPYTQITVSINDFTTKIYGIDTISAQIYAGNITEGDDSITNIAYMTGNNILLGPLSRTQAGNYSSFPQSINFNSVRETTSTIFKTRVLGQRSGISFVADSPSKRIRFEPIYYWGTSSLSSLTSTQITTELNRVDPSNSSSFYLYDHGSRPSSITHNFVPNSQYIYLVYPSFTNDGLIDWGTVSQIRDVNNNLTYSLNSYTTGQIILNFAQKSNLRYRIYRSTDLITPLDPLSPSTYRLQFTLGGTA